MNGIRLQVWLLEDVLWRGSASRPNLRGRGASRSWLHQNQHHLLVWYARCILVPLYCCLRTSPNAYFGHTPRPSISVAHRPFPSWYLPPNRDSILVMAAKAFTRCLTLSRDASNDETLDEVSLAAKISHIVSTSIQRSSLKTNRLRSLTAYFPTGVNFGC